jgi:membrane associated rhomboid family serine protease
MLVRTFPRRIRPVPTALFQPPRTLVRRQSQWQSPQQSWYNFRNAVQAAPTVVKALVVTNVVVFGAYTLYGPTNTNLRRFVKRHLVLSRPNVLRGYYDCLVGAMFMHGSVFHLGMNMYTLWSFAEPARYFLSQRQFLALFLATGVAGNLAQVRSSVVHAL